MKRLCVAIDRLPGGSRVALLGLPSAWNQQRASRNPDDVTAREAFEAAKELGTVRSVAGLSRELPGRGSMPTSLGRM